MRACVFFQLLFDRSKLALPFGPREEQRRPRRATLAPSFRRALERDNLVLAEVTAREI